MTDEQREPLYVNTVAFGMGAYDVAMEFSFRTPEEQQRQVRVGAKSQMIVMSLGHAKAMLPILAKMIAQYETEVGPITAPGFEGFAKE